jgi:hypothetical protein
MSPLFSTHFWGALITIFFGTMFAAFVASEEDPGFGDWVAFGCAIVALAFGVALLLERV